MRYWATEQGDHQHLTMTAAKVMRYQYRQIVRVRRTNVLADASIDLIGPGENHKDVLLPAHYWRTLPYRNVQTFGLIVWATTHYGLQSMVPSMEGPIWVLLSEICHGHLPLARLLWKATEFWRLKDPIEVRMVRRFSTLGIWYSYTVKKDYSYGCVCGCNNKIWLERNKHWSDEDKKYFISEKLKVIGRTQHLSLIMYTWDVLKRQCEIIQRYCLGCFEVQCETSKDIVAINLQTMFESRIDPQEDKFWAKLPCSENLCIVFVDPMNKDMEGHAEWNVTWSTTILHELANKNDWRQTLQSIKVHAVDDHQLAKEEEMKSVGESVKTRIELKLILTKCFQLIGIVLEETWWPVF